MERCQWAKLAGCTSEAATRNPDSDPEATTELPGGAFLSFFFFFLVENLLRSRVSSKHGNVPHRHTRKHAGNLLTAGRRGSLFVLFGWQKRAKKGYRLHRDQGLGCGRHTKSIYVDNVNWTALDSYRALLGLLTVM